MPQRFTIPLHTLGKVCLASLLWLCWTTVYASKPSIVPVAWTQAAMVNVADWNAQSNATSPGIVNITSGGNTIMRGASVNANTVNASGCAPSALGAVLGEGTASIVNGNRSIEDILANGVTPGTIELAALVGGTGVALVGGNAQQINLAANAGGNAAENNFGGQITGLANAAQRLAHGGWQAVSSAGQAALTRCAATPWCASLPMMAGAMATMNTNTTQMAGLPPDGAAPIPQGLSGSSPWTSTPGTPGTPLAAPPPLINPVTPPLVSSNTGGTPLDQPVDTQTPGYTPVAVGAGTTVSPAAAPQGVNVMLAVPPRDHGAITSGLNGVMGGMPTTPNGETRVVGGSNNIVSEYPNGSRADAERVFDSLPLNGVQPIRSGLGDWGRSGTLPDGTRVTVRPSQDGRPTIEIYDTNRPSGGRTVSEIRFGSR